MAVTYAEFVSDPRFSKFGLTPFEEDWVTLELNDAEADSYSSFWCKPDQHDRAIKLLTAHRLSKYNNANSEGIAIGEINSISSSDGSQSISFGSSTNEALGDELLKSTYYGIRYLDLQKRVQCNFSTGIVI